MFSEMSDAVAAIRPVDALAVPLGPGVPGGFLHALGERTDFEKLEVFGALMPDLYQLFMHPSVHYRSGFFGPAERFLRDAGASVDFVPADFRRFEPVLHHLNPRVMATSAAPFTPAPRSTSCTVPAPTPIDCSSWRSARTSHARSVPASTSTACGSTRSTSWCRAIASAAIAEFAIAYIHSGCTLQTGIGGIPSQVAKLLAAGPLDDFGVHSEMFTTGLMQLHQAGKVTNRKGSQFDGFSITTFAAGVPELYTWLHENEEVRFLPVKVVNSPELIAQNRDMVTINGALSVDLAGQVVADTINGTQFSGIGGHEDFVSGPGLSAEGRSLICVPSSTIVNGQVVSRVVPKLPSGSVVSTPRHQVDVIVTEYGAAELQGRTRRERALALAAIGHPDVRDDLLAVATTWPQD